jgi:glutamate racemase
MASSDKSVNPLTRSILVTDSGLGGLSVFNDIANRLELGSSWQTVKLVYVNAWPAPHRGYNHFDTREHRARIFNNALCAMAEFDPDVILIACNTLSVIYPHTQFYTSSDIRVEGIVDHGVQMVYENLIADPHSVAIILGTPTTIDARTHENALVRLGIAKDRIINIGCTNLAGWIEREPFSTTVHEMIREFVTEAATKLGNFSGHIYAALCCTHFGYRQALFEQAFAETVSANVTILNPNIRMAQQMVTSSDKHPSYPTVLDMQIVSKAVWSDEQLDAYLKLLPNISTATREALLHYKLDHQLFSVE